REDRRCLAGECAIGRRQSRMSVLERNNVREAGDGSRIMIFAHGFGCDQNMWRFVAPAFQPDFRTALFDHVGAGCSYLSASDAAAYRSLQGYADDVVEIGRTLHLKNAVFVGHSVSGMFGALASTKAAGVFDSLVMIGSSSRYID